MSAQFENLEHCKYLVKRDIQKMSECIDKIDTFEELAAAMYLTIQHYGILFGYFSSLVEDRTSFYELCKSTYNLFNDEESQ